MTSIFINPKPTNTDPIWISCALGACSVARFGGRRHALGMRITERQEGDLDRLRVLIRQEPAAMQRDRLRPVIVVIRGSVRPSIASTTHRSRSRRIAAGS